MKSDPRVPVIIIVDDDEGHAVLIRDCLQESGLSNKIEHFPDGQAALDFFFRPGRSVVVDKDQAYLVLLDIRMPKVDGVEVLRRLKADKDLRKLPIIMLTTTQDPREVARCHDLGCNIYLQKPIDYAKFADAMRRLGMFITLLLVPPVGEQT
jgi:CheY-like chemotaxis protein